MNGLPEEVFNSLRDEFVSAIEPIMEFAAKWGSIVENFDEVASEKQIDEIEKLLSKLDRALNCER